MFYNLHRNAVIGYKKLSDADLGISSTSHQTHIGLYEDTLKFTINYFQQLSAQLIYENNTYEVISLLDGIKNPDGTFRSPKIRIGRDDELNGIGVNSVARKIREIAGTEGNWYLLWFGLESEELVYFLVQDNSRDYAHLIQVLGSLNRGMLYQDDTSFQTILAYLLRKIDDVNFLYFEELELYSQIQERQIIKKVNPKKYDIDKALQRFKEIGREGEEIVNEHLQRIRHQGEIRDFIWMNQNSESGLPFDFEIQRNDGNILYSDSKATSYRFEQKMIFSSQELQFINKNRNYMVHRVFNLNENPQLKICNDIAKITDNFMHNYMNFNDAIRQNDIYINSMKISVPPTNKILNFHDEAI